MDDDDGCATCGSRSFNWEDGREYCINGHPTGRVEIGEDEFQEPGTQGRVVRSKETKIKQKVSKVFHGREAYRLFLQAWQFILWKQCHAMMHVEGMPTALWGVVRDLWSLRLAKLARTYREVDDEEDAGSQGPSSASQVSRAESELVDSTTEDEGESGIQKSARKASDAPLLIDTVALNYLGLLLLRYPLSLATVLEWIQAETVPFIRAIRHVPDVMKDKLPGEYQRLLDTLTILKPGDLLLAVYRAARMYSSSFGMALPAVNYLPILLHYIESLALPIQVYAMAKQLNTVTNFNFGYASTNTRSRRSILAFPEVSLMALVVVATKLLIPFDSTTSKRHPRSLADNGALRLDWDAWLAAKDTFDSTVAATMQTPIKPGTQLSLNDDDVLKMDDDALDAYMDWYQRTWANEDAGGEGVQREIVDMFPLKKLEAPTMQDIRTKGTHRRETIKKLREERLRTVLGSLESNQPISDEDAEGMEEGEGQRSSRILRPGDRYRQFSKVEEVTGVARTFHQEAADLACTSLGNLVRAVAKVESQIDAWRRQKQRREVFPEDVADLR